jgi:6 kDa early secretory antigenic target
MAGGFNVDKATMVQCAQHVETLVPEMQAQISRLNGEMDALFGSWSGVAASGFQNLHAKLSADFNVLHQNLGQIGESLTRNWQNYVTSDEQSAPRQV